MEAKIQMLFSTQSIILTFEISHNGSPPKFQLFPIANIDANVKINSIAALPIDISICDILRKFNDEYKNINITKYYEDFLRKVMITTFLSGCFLNTNET